MKPMLTVCPNCAALTSQSTCPLCYFPKPVANAVPPKARRKRRRRGRVSDGRNDFERSDPGNPLGRGMPLGVTFRVDGESHRDAWTRMLREEDPCSYCAGSGGTVDHIDPRSGPRVAGGLFTWLNLTAACSRCNMSKSAEKLLLWLARRGVLS